MFKKLKIIKSNSLIVSVLVFVIIFISACDKIDVSKLSDKDLQRISKELVVCNKPYIRYASECCLDKNDNAICDKDEKENVTKTKLTIPKLRFLHQCPGFFIHTEIPSC